MALFHSATPNLTLGCLCLARSGGDAIGLNTGGLCSTIGGLLVLVDEVVRIRKRSLAHSSQTLASAGGLAILLVGREVEGNEQHQVRAENDDAGKSSELLSGALAGIGDPGPVGGSEVCP